MFWGFSESLDLYEEYTKNVKPNDEQPSEIKVLLFGSADPRHILKTMSKRYQHHAKVHFYIIEACPALIARQIILLSIALEPPHLLTLSNRTHLFMDIYGNAIIRSPSMAYIDSKSKHLIKCITDLEFNEKMQPIFDFNHLKYVERDAMENVLNFWRENDRNQFDINASWTQRLRHYLRERYDTRQGAFDWDHQMRLKDNGAQQICSQEYRHWREIGVAFTFPEYRQSYANKTFALQPSQSNAGGYMGDISIGPFCVFGLSCHDQKLLKSNHGQNEYRATDITERNLLEIFYEIQEQQSATSESLIIHRLGMTKINTGKILEAKTHKTDENDLKKFNEPLISTDQIKISFLSMEDAQHLIDGNKFNREFDVVFIGRNYFPIVKKEFANVFTANALILFETAQFSIQRKPEIDKFLMKIREMAKEMNLKSISNFNINLPLSIAKFITIDPQE